MADKETNKKLHKDGHSRGEKKFKYGYVSGERWEGGSHHLRHENANDEKGFYKESVDSHGSYTHTEYHKEDKAHTGNFNAGEVRKYTFGGESSQCDGHTDMNGECTGRIEYLFDFGRAVGGDYHDAVKGQRKIITKGGEVKGQAGSSETIHHRVHKGAVTKDVTLDSNELIRKNRSVYVGGDSHIQYSEKEDTRYTGGNYDRYVGQKYHVYSKDAYIANTDSTFNTWSKQDMTMETDAKGNFKSKSDMTIESDSQITIKVGSSKITITSSKITIEATQIEVKASGSNDLEGHPLKINGGGTSSPPFTVP